jgi:GST-like protein
MYTLWGHRGWGSTLIEAQLDWYGVKFDSIWVNPLKRAEDRDRLVAVNPLAQLPTLVLEDGTIMTESAAITLMLADRAAAAGIAPAELLVPPPGAPERNRFLRWLVFLVANVYPTFTIGDDVSRWISGEAPQAELLQRSNAYRERMWQIVEDAATPGPWFLGSRFSALDIYVGVMTNWNPRRAWFAEHRKKLTAIALAADKHPKLAATWQRNFG